MCDDWGEVIRNVVFWVFLCAIVGATIYFAVLRPMQKIELTGNFNRCQTAIVCVDRVCDTVDGIFAPKEAEAQAVEQAIAKADK